jgi:phosphate transport system substrate-binding protein
LKNKYLLSFITGALLLVLISGCARFVDRENSLTAVGSSAMQPLLELAGEEFIKNHPKKIINIQGGGSGTGLSQVQSGAVEIGNSDLFAEEKSGIATQNLVDNKIAVVGIAVIVNDQARVKGITSQQLQGIFLGKIKNWREVGGANLPIVILNRAFGSGTRKTFEQFALNQQQAVASQEQDSSGMVKNIVLHTPGAISYLAFSYLSADLHFLKIDGIAPTKENVLNNRWKIWSYEHCYTKGKPSGLTKEFINYLLKNQHLVKKLKFIPVSEMKFERNARGETMMIEGISKN